MTPRCGPVQVNLPRDVLSAQSTFDAPQQPSNYRNHSLPVAHPDQIDAAATLLSSAAQPVIIAGGGIKNNLAHDAAIELARTLGCPIVTSPGHGDAIPFNEELNAGQMGPRGNPVASRLVKEADVIVALGTRLGFNSTFYSYDNINQAAKIIHIELEPTAIGRFFPIEIGIWSDAATAAIMLSQALRDIGNRVTADDAINYCTPKSLFTPLDFGLVGFSFACGLGVKCAMPERPVISLMGDGGFGMTMSELSTAVDHGINTVTIVMNNQCWGAEKAYQRDFFNGRFIGADVSSPAFDKVADLYGAKGFRAERLTDVAPAVEAALACGKPAVVDVAVDPAALYSFRRDSFKHRGG